MQIQADTLPLRPEQCCRAVGSPSMPRPRVSGLCSALSTEWLLEGIPCSLGASPWMIPAGQEKRTM